jgi:glycerate 2-kinase
VLNEVEQRSLLLSMFEAGIAAVQADKCLPPHLPADRPQGRTALFSLGKAAGHMARAALAHVRVDEALIITRHGHMPPDWNPPPFANVIEAGHPNPDSASLAAGEAAIALASALGRGDRLIALISGGGSALMAAPVHDIDFADKQVINSALLAAGAPIADMNRVRAALSRLKGGQLSEIARPAQILTYVLSDVPGDDPAFVASGPTCAMPEGEDAMAILARHKVTVLPHVADALHRQRPAKGTADQVVIFAKAADALVAMAQQASASGFEPVLLGDAVEEDAAELARVHAALALKYRDAGRRVALISGGEASVSVRNPDGVGGRNQTYALTLTMALEAVEGICALAADSDGIDGTSDAAGAMIFPSTLRRATERNINVGQALRQQDSCVLFTKLGDKIVTGPTGTNVNDLRIVLVDPG